MNTININVEPTKNENIVKFLADSSLVESKSYEFSSIEEASNSPLSQQLFQYPFIKTIYISHNFIAIEKHDMIEWDEIKDELASTISEYINANKSVIKTNMSEIPITLYAESTPNPSVIKFVANKTLVDGMFEFKDKNMAEPYSPLAMELFKFPFIQEIFFSSNYISITKKDHIEWQEMVNDLRDFIRNYLASGKTVIDKASAKEYKQLGTNQQNVNIHNKPLSEIDKQIISILDEYVKPAVEGDGGHIAFDSYNEETKTVKVILQGACSGCPSSTITLKNGIESMLREMLNGKVQTVEAING
jgi:Fe-S cluster biogenesis protein NfuA